MNSWKRGQILAETAVTLAKDEPEAANQVLDLLGENKFSRGARRQIEAGWSGPHQFIPYFQRLQHEPGNPNAA